MALQHTALCQKLDIGKASQVGAYLGQEDFRPTLADARHGIKQLSAGLRETPTFGGRFCPMGSLESDQNADTEYLGSSILRSWA